MAAQVSAIHTFVRGGERKENYVGISESNAKIAKENNKSKISFNESIVPRRQKLRISQAGGGSGSKFGGLSVSKAQILRRHTLHDKSNIRQSLQNVHVHSWHKQVGKLS